jgi:hypothetical protein
VVLAEELAGARSVMDALVGYDKRRHPLVRRVQTAAAMLQRLCGIEQVPALRGRDTLLTGLARFPRLSEDVIRRALAADVRTVRSASLLGDAREVDHHERELFGLMSVASVANVENHGPSARGSRRRGNAGHKRKGRSVAVMNWKPADDSKAYGPSDRLSETFDLAQEGAFKRAE